jgi:hypothetical protein
MASLDSGFTMIELVFDCKAVQLELLGVTDRLDIHDRAGQA